MPAIALASSFAAPATRALLIAFAVLLTAAAFAPSAQARPLETNSQAAIEEVDLSAIYSAEKPSHQLICVCECSDGNYVETQTFNRPFGSDCSDIDNDNCTQGDGDSGQLQGCYADTIPNDNDREPYLLR